MIQRAREDRPTEVNIEMAKSITNDIVSKLTAVIDRKFQYLEAKIDMISHRYVTPSAPNSDDVKIPNSQIKTPINAPNTENGGQSSE